VSVVLIFNVAFVMIFNKKNTYNSPSGIRPLGHRQLCPSATAREEQAKGETNVLNKSKNKNKKTKQTKLQQRSYCKKSKGAYPWLCYTKS
jgi:hypothetical protein